MPAARAQAQIWSKSLFTTERLTESTVVLPLAAAFMQLVSEASKVSADHASVLASKLQCLDSPESLNDPMFAMQNGHAQCQIQIVHFLRYGQEGENHGSNKTHVTINLQRPDSIVVINGLLPRTNRKDGHLIGKGIQETKIVNSDAASPTSNNNYEHACYR